MLNTETDIQEFITHYKICALGASHDFCTVEEEEHGMSGKPMDEVHKEWAPEALKQIEEDCRSFISANIDKLTGWTPSQAGHDFFLTRNRHGTGFWDRGLPHGRALSDASHPYGTSEPYTGDDGLTYLHG